MDRVLFPLSNPTTDADADAASCRDKTQIDQHRRNGGESLVVHFWHGTGAALTMGRFFFFWHATMVSYMDENGVNGLSPMLILRVA